MPRSPDMRSRELLETLWDVTSAPHGAGDLPLHSDEKVSLKDVKDESCHDADIFRCQLAIP